MKKMNKMEDKKYWEWYADHNNIVALCRFLHDVKGVSVEDLLYALEKPYKYEDEYKEMLELRESEE
tara:strand:+ start:1661 stop:1858 length:198 start_codon:yes stop_codon:yes gene_type:complete